ncbi:DUF4388 domain-containing protein [Pelobacter seleniigenes]|uniref:DUF4388 domain-containing protein n=1 Tax=Pelobacter seleniigenes TaxID=407188 RepID=UPI00055BCEC6|nr:DUF4388 domain-containing protein [Pelobacter seleniigenes]
MEKLKIDKTGIVKLPGRLVQALGTEPLCPVSGSSEHVFLARPEAKNPVLFAGILEAGAVADLLSFFNMFRKTGLLNIELEGGQKSLYFQQGEIVFATSTFTSEDIGEVLFSLGKIERDTLNLVRSQVTEHQTLGKLLVEQAAVSPKDLWLAARSQVENIVYALFAAGCGGFSFQVRAIDQEQILRLSMSTQNLIMEGLRRQDEKALFMRKIVSLDSFPKETGREGVDLSQGEARLLSAAQAGQLSAKELFRRVGLHEFDGLRILYGLIEKKLLRMEDTPAVEVAGELGEILAIYNKLFQSLFSSVDSNGSGFLAEMKESLRELPQPYSFVLRDVELLADGTLDGQRIVGNLVGLEEGDREKLLADSLCEVAYMETMLLRRELAADQARPLISKVQEVTGKVRHLVGRH